MNLTRETASNPNEILTLKCNLHVEYARPAAFLLSIEFMSLSVEQISSHPRMVTALKQQSRTMLEVYDSSPRLSAVFASQQRWLMAHIGLALYFRSHIDPLHRRLTVAHFIENVLAHGIASRNTADAFVKEMLNYQFICMLSNSADKRSRPIRMTDDSLEIVSAWVALHLTTLDALDDGRRMEVFSSRPELIAQIEPLIADGLLARPTIRKPSGTFSLFAWLDKGGIVLDRITAGLADMPASAPRIPTEIISATEMAQWLNLSRSHLMRKLREAEALGAIGWSGKRSQSAIWVSRGFFNEIVEAQAVKLAVIDAAFEGAQT